MSAWDDDAPEMISHVTLQAINARGRLQLGTDQEIDVAQVRRQPESIAAYLERRVRAYAFFVGQIAAIEGWLRNGLRTPIEGARELQAAREYLTRELGKVSR